MYGGLLKTASAAAILAAAGLFGASSAKAADLGGDCCADLEERVAELEATTVRKGNRKVAVTLSGFVGHNVMWWDDGHQSDVYIGDGGNYFSRFRFVGTAKISPTVTAGFLYEFGIDNNRIGNMNQANGGDDLPGASTVNARTDVLRDSTVWLRHSQLGMVKVGHGSTATDNLVLIDLAGMNGAGTPDLGLYIGGFRLRGTNGAIGNANQTWGRALTGTESWDTSRRNHVMYEAPTIAGFTLQAAVGEDNYWDVALRYAGEFGGFRLAFGIGYQEDSEFNGPSQGFGATSVTCATLCDVKTQEVKGSASLLHVPTGLFVTGSGGQRQLDGTGTAGVPDLTYWMVAAGVSQNYFGIGKTVLFGEYGEHKGGLGQTSFLVGASGLDSKVTNWGLGVNQFIDAAAMEVFLTYKHFEIEDNTLTSLSDMNVVIGGARVNF